MFLYAQKFSDGVSLSNFFFIAILVHILRIHSQTQGH